MKKIFLRRTAAILTLSLLLPGCGKVSKTAPVVPADGPKSSDAPTPTAEPTPCAHPLWENGVCTICGESCPHNSHDSVTLLCTGCGERLLHHYENGVCVYCGASPVFYDSEMPPEMFATADAAGTVDKVTYETLRYTAEHPEGEGEPFEKTMYVYRPADYDSGKKYDVVLLLHGKGQTEKAWLLTNNYCTQSKSQVISGAQLLDNFYAQGICQDVIVVSVTYYKNSRNPRQFDRVIEYPQFIGELRHEILPAIVENYSTWAASGNREDLINARDHFGIAGLSMGAVVIYSDILMYAPELFGWYGAMSGADGYTDQISASLEACADKGYPVRCFYNCIGSRDEYFNLQSEYFKDLTGRCRALNDGENAFFTEMPDGGHDFRTWYAGLHNMMQVFFKMN